MPIKIFVRLGSAMEPLSEQAFDKETIAIGRSLGNDIVLPDSEKKVSGKHARIEVRGGHMQIKDLGSTNGTYVNNNKIAANTLVPLMESDEISIGSFHLSMAGGPTMETTTRQLDPARVAETLAEELALVYARHAQDPPEERNRAMARATREGMQAAGIQNARAVLSLLQKKFGAGGSDGKEEDSQITRQEELYRAGYKGVQELSEHFLGEIPFQSADQVERFVKQVRQTVETTLLWVSRSLKGRREFENEFSADLTMVFSKEGNPLKTAAGPSELGKILLDWSRSRDLAASHDLLDNAFKDLTMHQLGLVAGVQDCLRALLQQLDPKVIQSTVYTQNAAGLAKFFLTFSLSKKSWQQYVRRHQELFENNSKLFNELIYPELRKGYLSSHAEEGTPGTGTKSTVQTTPPPTQATIKEIPSGPAVVPGEKGGEETSS